MILIDLNCLGTYGMWVLNPHFCNHPISPRIRNTQFITRWSTNPNKGCSHFFSCNGHIAPPPPPNYVEY